MNTIQKKLFPIGVIALTVIPLLTGPAYAIYGTPNPTRAERKQERQEKMTTLRRTRADGEIDRRVAALTSLLGRLNGMKHLSDDKKSNLTSQVNSAIANLQALKTKIDGDTDPATLLADKKSIVDSYRIFALFMPQIRIMAYADSLIDVAQLMKTKTTDATALAKIDDAITQATNAINAVSVLTPEGYPGNKGTLDGARGMLKTAREDLKAARGSIKDTVKEMRKTTTTAKENTEQ